MKFNWKVFIVGDNGKTQEIYICHGELRMKGSSGAQASKAEKLASFYDFALFILHEYLVNPQLWKLRLNSNIVSLESRKVETNQGDKFCIACLFS